MLLPAASRSASAHGETPPHFSLRASVARSARIRGTFRRASGVSFRSTLRFYKYTSFMARGTNITPQETRPCSLTRQRLCYNKYVILLDRVTKIYGKEGSSALNRVSLHVEPKEFVILVGTSGAGKSTLLKILTREERPTSGKIVVGGIDYDTLKDKNIPL